MGIDGIAGNGHVVYPDLTADTKSVWSIGEAKVVFETASSPPFEIGGICEKDVRGYPGGPEGVPPRSALEAVYLRP